MLHQQFIVIWSGRVIHLKKSGTLVRLCRVVDSAQYLGEIRCGTFRVTDMEDFNATKSVDMPSDTSSGLRSCSASSRLLDSGINGIQNVAQLLENTLCVLQSSSNQSNFGSKLNSSLQSHRSDVIDSNHLQKSTASRGGIASKSTWGRKQIFTKSIARQVASKTVHGSVTSNRNIAELDLWHVTYVNVCAVKCLVGSEQLVMRFKMTGTGCCCA